MKKNKMYSERYYAGGAESNYLMYSDEYGHPYYTALMELILKKCANRGRLLEIGCAFGFFARHAEKKFETCGIDISEYAIEQAGKYTHTAKLYVADAENTNLTRFFNGRFGIIVALDVFEHFQRPEVVIEDCYALLNQGGYLLLKVPNMNSIVLKFLTLFNRSDKWVGYKDKTHVSLLTAEQWASLLRKQKFEVTIVSHVPTKKLKTFFLNHCPSLFFLPRFFNYFNNSILFMCKK